MKINHKYRNDAAPATARFKNGARAWNKEHSIDYGNVMFTSEGGLAILLTNKTGAASVKGNCVTPNEGQNNTVKLVPVNVPNCIGVFYESGIADGMKAWIVIAGIADVYFSGSATRGHLARTGLTADVGEVAGQALSEAFPAAPFLVDKHFCEIGHVLETRNGAGLAKVVLHFN